MNHVYKKADRVQCRKCHGYYSTIGITRHSAVCLGAGRKLPDGHRLCDCGRIKASEARTCFRCETKDEVFAELDARIDSRREDAPPAYQVGPRVARLMRVSELREEVVRSEDQDGSACRNIYHGSARLDRLARTVEALD